MGERDPLGEFLVGEIIRERAQGKRLSARIYGVRAEIQRDFKFVQVARRREQFRFCHVLLLAAKNRGDLLRALVGRSPVRRDPPALRPLKERQIGNGSFDDVRFPLSRRDIRP